MEEFSTPDETLPVEWVERSDLLPNDWNPNTMTDEKREELVHSITDNGWTQPLVIKGDGDEILDGEQRWHAAGDSRVSENEDVTPDGVDAGHVPVFRLHVDDTQARVATMQHNVNGEMDSEGLGAIFSRLDEDGFFYEVSERFTIGEKGIDRLIERHENEDDPDDSWYDDETEETEAAEAFTRQLQFQMTEAERERLDSVLDHVSVLELCQWAVENNIHSQTRVDMRALADRDSVFEAGEDTIEYPEVDVSRHLGEYRRDDEEVESETEEAEV